MAEETIARNGARRFDAACGHEVGAYNDYVVKRPGVFYCSPDCAAEDTTREITIRLKDEGNLETLLEGQWSCLIWLVDNGDGTYGLHGGGVSTSNPAGEAFLRVGMEIALAASGGALEGLPAVVASEPSPEVASWMARISTRLGAGPLE